MTETMDDIPALDEFSGSHDGVSVVVMEVERESVVR